MLICVIFRRGGIFAIWIANNYKKEKPIRNRLCYKHNLAYHAGVTGKLYLQERRGRLHRRFACCQGRPVISFVTLRISKMDKMELVMDEMELVILLSSKSIDHLLWYVAKTVRKAVQ